MSTTNTIYVSAEFIRISNDKNEPVIFHPLNGSTELSTYLNVFDGETIMLFPMDDIIHITINNERDLISSGSVELLHCGDRMTWREARGY